MINVSSSHKPSDGRQRSHSQTSCEQVCSLKTIPFKFGGDKWPPCCSHLISNLPICPGNHPAFPPLEVFFFLISPIAANRCSRMLCTGHCLTQICQETSLHKFMDVETMRQVVLKAFGCVLNERVPNGLLEFAQDFLTCRLTGGCEEITYIYKICRVF